MQTGTSEATDNTEGIEADDGRAAAERLARDWPNTAWVPDSPSEPWARAAIEQLGRIIREQPSLFRASQEGSERGAESLSTRKFQGLLESLQNADDLGASELRFGLRRAARRRELLVAHDGDPVRLDHVGAMALPWVSTKGDDPRASGRFGIGQKTLRSLGGPIQIHCPPFHLRMDPEGPVVMIAAAAVPAIYSPEQRDTLLVVPLAGGIEEAELRAFVDELGARSLLFLRSVRRIAFFGSDQTLRVDHRLTPRSVEEVQLRLRGEVRSALRSDLDSPAGEHFTTYLVEAPLSGTDQRHHKATGTTTSLGVALGLRSGGGLYDRLPLPIDFGPPVGLNAQFDPDTGRGTLLQRPWNERRLDDLAELLARVALDAFDRDVAGGWAAIPLQSESSGQSGWVEEQLGKVVRAAQTLICDELKLGTGEGAHQLQDIVYEDEALEGIITTGDQRRLAPGRHVIPLTNRDKDGRWRRVLNELGVSQRLNTFGAIELFDLDDDELGPREPEWFVAMAAAAVRQGALWSMLPRRSVLLRDGTRIAAPRSDEPRSLVCRLSPTSLAASLKLGLPLHPVYLETTTASRTVVEALKAEDVLLDHLDSADAALDLLAEENRVDARVQVDDEDLLLLRDALERRDEDDQRSMGRVVGRNVELRAFAYDERGKRTELWATPADAYLPSSVDREVDSFAKAAGRTPGLSWLAPGYASLLKRPSRVSLGAQRFLVLLGAATAPRLQPPPDERSRWSRDTRPASDIASHDRPELQLSEIRAHRGATHLLRDRWSPDLDAVIADISKQRGRDRRRTRGLALLSVIARAWDRHYAEHLQAAAVRAFNGYWQDANPVVATWLARAATAAWLPSAAGTLKTPSELYLPTDATRLAFGTQKTRFLTQVSEQLARHPALPALGLRTGPGVEELIAHLRELRDEPVKRDVESDASTIYQLLSLACQQSNGRQIDNMSVSQFRRAFTDRARRGGLLLVRSQWLGPSQVLRGTPIFGQWSQFVADSPALEPLWRTLDIRTPEARDCLVVLRRLSKEPLVREDRPVVVESLRLLAGELDSLSPQLRAQLRKLPLWTTRGEWSDKRPMLAVEAREWEAHAVASAPLWDHDFASFSGLEVLLSQLGVTPVTVDDLEIVGGQPQGAADQALSRVFALAVDHLQDELARGDQRLHDALLAAWDDLRRAPVFIDVNLRVAAGHSRRSPIAVESGAHILRSPLSVVVRSEHDLGAAEHGGRAIASMFSGDRQKISWAWSAVWKRALEGRPADPLRLSTSGRGRDDSIDRLHRLQRAATERSRSGKSTGSLGSANGGVPYKTAPSVRPLRNLDDLEPDRGEVVNRGKSTSGVLLPRRRTSATRSPMTPLGKGRPPLRRRAVLPASSDREQLAYDAVRRALALNPQQIVDLRRRRGIGADAMDELRQLFEIKMESSPDFPKEVTLTPSEVDAAQDDPDFFLAIVVGLEDGPGQLRVRFIFDPLSRTARRISGSVTLSGVDEVEALEYKFPAQTMPTDSGVPRA